MRKCEIRNQWVRENHISMLYTLLVQLFSKGTAETKLEILAFLYCDKFAKNSYTLGDFF